MGRTAAPSPMKKQDYAWIAGLIASAAYIWARNRSWLPTADETLPILSGFVFLVWLPWPWVLSSDRLPARRGPCMAALGLGLLGLLLDSTLILAGAWTLLLWSWLSVRVSPGQRERLRMLMVLPLLAFPWIATDLARLSWYFRISAAAATEMLFRWSQFHVVREGTYLTVNGFALSVEPACSGLNGLQALLTAGTALAYLRLRHTRLFWPSLLLLPIAAWIANLLRILFAAGLGAELSAASAARWVGPLHLVAGWFAIVVMFAVCGGVFGAIGRRSDAIEAYWLRVRASFPPLLESTVLAYAAWQCRAIVPSWRHAPFDRMGWLAFIVWLVPAVARRAPRERAEAAGWRLQVPALGAGALALLAAGQLGDFNLLRQAGLAAALSAVAPVRQRWLWLAGSLSWMSAFGWAASQVGASAVLVAGARVALAATIAAFELTRLNQAPLDRALTPLAYARIK
jgi:exosortase/archaeosortase family protein